MGSISPRTVTLRDGSRVLVRSATPEDAARVASMMVEMAAASPWILTLPSEIMPAADWPGEIARRTAPPTGLMILGIELDGAGNEGAVIGSLAFHVSSRSKSAHQAELGMGMIPAARGRGLGRAMLEAALDFAALTPGLEVVRLGVIPENTAAVRLYRSLGFAEEGRQARFLKLPDGSRHDHILMAIFVKPGLAPTSVDGGRYCCWMPRTADAQ